MSTQDFPQGTPRTTTPTPGLDDPLMPPVVVPDDQFTEPPAGPLTPSVGTQSGESLGGQRTNDAARATAGIGGMHGQDTKSVAQDEARQLGHESAETAKQVGHTAKEEAGKVAHEAKEQVRNLVGELGSDLKSQAGAQQQKVAQGLRSVSEELRSMADNSQGGGTATSLVDQAAGKAGDAADWLDGRDPGSLLEEVKGFARRRPGVFLAVAAGAGLLAGRLARGMTGDASSVDGSAASYTGGPSMDTAGARAPERFAADTDRGYPRP